MSKQPSPQTSDEPIATVIGIGGFGGKLVGFLRRFRLPAIALGRRHLYRVMLEGSGFELPFEPSSPEDRNPTGFLTTRFVAARTRAEAETKARSSVIRDWQGLSLMSHFTGVDEPSLIVTESIAIDGWFRSRSGGGFIFFTVDSDG